MLELRSKYVSHPQYQHVTKTYTQSQKRKHQGTRPSFWSIDVILIFFLHMHLSLHPFYSPAPSFSSDTFDWQRRDCEQKVA